MGRCDALHKDYDRLANAGVNVGELPRWMRVQGKVAWYVFEGPYSRLAEGWDAFHRKVAATKRTDLVGPPGDVYVCDPNEHEADPEKTITILFMPLNA